MAETWPSIFGMELRVPVCSGWMMCVVGRKCWAYAEESLCSMSLKEHREVGMKNQRTEVPCSAQGHTAAPK